MRKLKVLVLVVLTVIMIGSSLLYVLQEKIIFLPTKLERDYQYTFSEPFEELFLTAADGAELNALHFKKPNSKGLILYFHGNAGDLSRWGEIVTFFTKQGFDVLVMDYRTYGKSTGVLSEANLFDDAALFYEYALRHYTEENIIVYGRSLGTGIATYLASVKQPKKLILETPFYNLNDVARKRFPILPTKSLLKYTFSSNEHIQKVTCPIAIFHGTDDAIISFKSGKKLYDAILRVPKVFYTVENGGHNDLVNFEAYQKGIAIELNQTD